MTEKYLPPYTPSWQFLWQHPAYLLAFGLGSGLSKWAPGTVGSLIAIPLYCLFTMLLSPLLIWIVIVATFFIGAWAAEQTSSALGSHDHGGIVIDEIVAMWMILSIAPYNSFGMIISFILFRFFDIFKPWPISWVDRHVSGGLGIMLDDIIAALFAIAVLMLL